MYQQCQKCKKLKSDISFLKFKDQTYDNICRDCIKQDIEQGDLITKLEYCRRYDIPFYPNDYYYYLCNKTRYHYPFQVYLQKMKYRFLIFYIFDIADTYFTPL